MKLSSLCLTMFVSIGVRDIRSDHLKHLCHMFSMLAVKSRIPPQHNACILPRALHHATIVCCLPTESDISSVRLNLAQDTLYLH